ncbi:sce7726 family protein [Desulfogranum japonicum]|uniref:sce7726 family protein n=1 Tax=Desulfogranum japonicum TaxID=231447 RepID=UPI00048B3C9E|nr:sce7726 family protein [Desulfogranum japonicum]
MQLNDSDIRKSLIQKLGSQAKKPKAIVEELRVHNGNAIADVVAIYDNAHCYEIKGDGDKIERAVEQGEFFNQVFWKISLVTTSKHVEKALSILPHFWGIMEAQEIDGTVRIAYVRKSVPNSNFDKKKALLTLWKSEMLNLVAPQQRKKHIWTRDSLSTQISQAKRKVQISREISSLLTERCQKRCL